jgi:superfamily I DNA/RNA helicase
MTSKFNDAQRDAIESTDSVFVCACPGSGKTRVLVARVARILKEDQRAKVLMTTFSREAVNEMINRVKLDKTIPPAALKNLTVGTFHALALRQLRAVKPDIRLLSNIELWHLISKAIPIARIAITFEDADAVIARCKADPQFEQDNPEFSRLTQCYRDLQKKTGSWDFTDLLIETNIAMEAGRIPPIEAQHILADEFQDIDKPQLEWVLHHIRQKSVVCAVGDDDQSIYGFRRALGYAGIEEFIEAVGARKILMGINYRSTQAIVDHAVKLIELNQQRLPKEITVYRGAGIVPTVLTESEQDTQVQKIVRRLDKICANNPIPPPWPTPTSDPYRFGVRKGQAAVLARTNAQLMPIEAVFQAERIPYFKPGKSIWDAHVLQVFLSVLDSLVNSVEQGFEIALQWAKIHERDIEAVKTATKTTSILGVLESDVGDTLLESIKNPDLRGFIRFGSTWIDKLDAHDSVAVIYGVAGWMSSILFQHGNTKGKQDWRTSSDLNKLEIASNALAEAKGSLRSRIQRVRMTDQNKNLPRVILTTFHAAKGMEWENVFLIDVNEGLVPKLTGEGGLEELEEERRVFYVAMTRARDTLTILGARNRQMSPFLVEAGLLTEGDAAKGVARAYGKVFKQTKTGKPARKKSPRR